MKSRDDFKSSREPRFVVAEWWEAVGGGEETARGEREVGGGEEEEAYELFRPPIKRRED